MSKITNDGLTRSIISGCQKFNGTSAQLSYTVQVTMLPVPHTINKQISQLWVQPAALFLPTTNNCTTQQLLDSC